MRKPRRPVCPVCGELADRAATNYGWRMSHCGLWSWGSHPLADAKTHQARRQAHAAFDPLWKSRGLSRGEAYKRLAEKLGVPEQAAHMKIMDTATASRVPEAVRQIYADLADARTPPAFRPR